MGQLGLFSVTNLLLIRMPREFYKESWLNPHKLNLSCTQRSLFQNSKIEPSKELTSCNLLPFDLKLNIELVAYAKAEESTKTETSSLISNANVVRRNVSGSNKIQLL